MIIGLGASTNANNDNNKWNSPDGVSSTALISKVKLN
jgi:hypothetical protein